MEERVHLKGLNGLRAIAAIGVVAAHTSLPEFHLNEILPTGLASFSVTIFFTLSGFLITYLLIIEKRKKDISIKKFYIRRILRIWPLYFAYLLTAIIIIYFQTPDKLPGSLAFYLFFAANVPAILQAPLPYLAHYWSIGVEEQFYLFWPWIIKKSNALLKSMIIFTAVFLIFKMVARFVFFEQGNPIPLSISYMTSFEYMSIGGIGALLCIKKNSFFFRITANKFTEITCWLYIIVIAVNSHFISHFANHDIIAMVTVCLIVNLSFNTKAIINLENHFFDFLGKISYGIYVIHPLVIFTFLRILNRLNLVPAWKYIILNCGVILLTILFAWLSYEFLEKRFLRLKDKFSTIKSADSRYKD